jgi:hypothetical protein
MRFLVIQPRLAGAASQPAVGVVRWRAPGPALSVIVKATLSFAGDALALAGDQEPLAPEDFVPAKAAPDVLLTGDAFAPRGPSSRIDARVELGWFSRAFAVMAGASVERIPLDPGYLREVDGVSPAAPVGPAPAPAFDPQGIHEPDFDFSRYNRAAPQQRTPGMGPGDPLILTGLSPRGERRLSLPELAPRALVRWAAGGNSEVPMACDTVAIDTVAERCALVFRGWIEVASYGAIDRIVVAPEQAPARRDWYRILQPLARGSFSFAAERGALDTGPRPGTDEPERVEIARLEALELEDGPEPEISLEQYAAVSAELAEQAAPRAEVLDRHGLDEGTWLLEERGWLERMANRAMEGDGTLAARYGALFTEAQDRLATPAELRATLDAYAEALVALERADDPVAALARREMTFARWMRLDRRWTRACAADPELAAALERHAAAARARGA